MLSKKDRISKGFFSTLRRPTRLQGTYCSLSLFPLSTGERARAACVISKKISHSAVERNRIRRRFYAALQPLLKQRLTPAALVVYPRREALSASYESIRQDLSMLLKKSVERSD